MRHSFRGRFARRVIHDLQKVAVTDCRPRFLRSTEVTPEWYEFQLPRPTSRLTSFLNASHFPPFALFALSSSHARGLFEDTCFSGYK